ncbi:Tetratricopeptide-like helical domain superfamily [Sesbania bispinosa]|nr:Tetratricopeptide-like helical domain superfamily [Sesbania bispinosa]
MFRVAAKLSPRASSTALVSLTAKPSPISRPSPLAASSFRSFNNGLELDKNMAVPDAVRMINYAMRQARTDQSVGSYGLGMLVLKHCLETELTEGKDPQHENSKGIALLAMSTLMSERGKYSDAIEKLQSVQELTNSFLGVRVAAFEAQAGLHLELGQDDMASVVADKCVELLEKQKTGDFEALNIRAKALKGLVELVNGNVESAEAFFDKSLCDKLCDGTAALSYGEFLQTKQNYSMAKEVYRNVIQGATEIKESGNPYLGAGNMNLEGLMMGAMCALGQLESHLGNFGNAEQHLTKALNKAEETYGDRHPKVGVVLTCIALMYRRKAIQEHSSSLLIQEGLYRRVTDLLKVPPVETESEGAAPLVDRSDIAALARGMMDSFIHGSDWTVIPDKEWSNFVQN